MLVSTALTATLHVPQTVKTTRVKYKVEHASHVNLDGVEWTVIQVRFLIVSLANSHIRIRYYFYFILTFRKALFKTKLYHFCITECREGWYGVNCSQQCSGHCKDDTPCNHVTGLCDNGCDAGWKELKCDEGKTCNLTSTKKNYRKHQKIAQSICCSTHRHIIIMYTCIIQLCFKNFPFWNLWLCNFYLPFRTKTSN